jgi:competence protein ComEC
VQVLTSSIGEINMAGKFLYFGVASLLAVSAALIKIIPFFLLLIFYLYFLYKYKSLTERQLLVLLFTSICFFSIGYYAGKTNDSVIPKDSTTFTVEYSQDPKIDGDLLQIQAYEKVYNEKLLIRYKIKSQREQAALKGQSFYGNTCSISGALELPRAAKNPNAFDYRRYLATKGIFWMIESEKNPLENCIAASKNNPVITLKHLRLNGIRYLENNFPPEIASLSAALIFGDRSLLEHHVLEAYQETGIVHLLAISGLHVSLLISMFFYMGIRVGLTRQLMSNFLLVLLPVYVILTGGSASVLRAALMIFLILLTEKFQGRLKLLPIDAISIAFLLCLAFNPLYIFDVGFQLSFSVSLAIILSSAHILKHYQKLSAMLAISVAAQLAAFPFLLYHFFELSLIGIFANLVYIPLFSFVYLPGLYLLFFLQLLFGKTPFILSAIFIKIIELFNKLIAFLADLDFAVFVPGRPNLPLVIIYTILIFAIFYAWETTFLLKSKRRLIVLVLCLFSIQPAWNWFQPYGEVTVIDVGQGDSILIHLPRRLGTYLIDTGGTLGFIEEEWRRRAKPYEVGRDVVVPYLKGKGITKIDKLILTHGDMDHIGGALAVMQEINVKEVLLPAVEETSQTEREIIEQAKIKEIPVLFVSEGYHWKRKTSEFYILAPGQSFKGERNSGSIAIVAKIGGLSWFFGGDLDQAGEEKIIEKYPNLHVDVLKAGHHGSRTSSAASFVRQLQPTFALISAGENNRFGHPHQEVLTLLGDKGTIIYRTDKNGAITYRFFNEKGTFIPYLP